MRMSLFCLVALASLNALADVYDDAPMMCEYRDDLTRAKEAGYYSVPGSVEWTGTNTLNVVGQDMARATGVDFVIIARGGNSSELLRAPTRVVGWKVSNGDKGTISILLSDAQLEAYRRLLISRKGVVFLHPRPIGVMIELKPKQ